ncbi:548_t:CDS:2 [Ambispora gerdemannii]|uniref:548_t:CDS:1 n=1 Tax=Ambispora gerdemannii TaxID=144530 RepID=A0A9N9CBI5_9GLOM|nr:548_t:CDS:2 [Ambispora gerdemannii]
MSQNRVPTSMHAIQMENYGPPSVLEYVETKAPEAPKKTQVLVKIAAAGVNPAEYKIRRGYLSSVAKIRFPAVIGADYSGFIIAKGDQVTDFDIGDEVFGTIANVFSGKGSYAEYVLVDTKLDAIAKKPSNMSHEEAAGVGIAFMTTYSALIHGGNLKTDDAAKSLNQKILIIGASGGIGHYATQIGKNVCHAHVTAINSAKNAEFVKSLGADRVIDYTTTPDFVQALLQEQEKESFDMVLDCVGGDEYYQKSIPLLKNSGVFTTVVGPLDLSSQSSHLGYGKLLSFAGRILYNKLLGKRSYTLVFATLHSKFPEFVGYFERKQVVTKIGSKFELKDAAKAHELSESCHAVGKIILTV